ncbi:DUF4833 domain-containing protein [Sphingobacterium sp. SRCM116780]|uniref:DUF4833 domain-containing protein n=1 Tax=Sphingobacterium sp. SRCM116780 TaxID=2907623 RepID=UPI001F391FE6|nr:DUF4833 domain-containing protein [Sphingobacterium sp. SRCM116780]UIR55489.1 DUF4833 domain-containing protein [Sphingobacterium sp. SRCM116780]
MKRFITFVSLLIIYCNTSFSQTGYPTPPKKANMLFYIQHSEGHNTYVYEANVAAKSKLNTEEPVHIYRILYDKNGEIKPLTKIQEKFAYGIQSESVGNNAFEIALVAYKDQKLYLRMNKAGKPFVETTLNGHKFNLQRIFIKQKDGTSGLSTQVDYLVFYGTDQKGNKVQEKLIP